jgi:hypothetical protein
MKRGLSYLSIIGASRSKESLEGVESGHGECDEVDEEFASNVEEYEEEVDADQAQEGIDLGNGGLSLKIVEERELGKLGRERRCGQRRSNLSMHVCGV